jgi:FtsH-binding integral membrane protein
MRDGWWMVFSVRPRVCRVRFIKNWRGLAAWEASMNDLRDQTRPISAVRSTSSVSSVFMQQVYLWMTAAMGVTAVASYVTASSPAILSLFFSGVMPLILLCVAVFGLVVFLTSAMPRLSAGAATGFFLLYAGLMGVLLGPTLLVYSSASVGQAFVVTAGMFAGMSVFGTLTKRDLSGIGSFLIMGLWGIVLAMIVNIFLKSSSLDFAISVIGVLVFTGLTAFDTQKLRRMGANAPLDDTLAVRRGAILGALTLYLDFINLFLLLLRLLGDRK